MPMVHVIILIFILTLVGSSSSIGIIYAMNWHIKDSRVKDNLYLQSAVTSVFTMYFVITYLGFNLPRDLVLILNVLDFLERIITVLLLFGSIVRYALCLISQKEANRERTVIYSCLAFFLTISLIADFVIRDGGPIELAGEIALHSFLISLLVYISIRLGMTAFTNSDRESKKAVIFYCAIIAYLTLGFILHSLYRDFRSFESFTSFVWLLSIYTVTYSFSLLKKPAQIQAISLEEIEPYLNSVHISNRETDIIKQILAGQSNKKIAEALYISENTVKTHIRNIFDKTGTNSRINLIAKLHGHPKG